MIEQIDIYVRFIAIGACLLLTAMALAGEIRPRLKWVFAPMVVGVMAYLINSAPQFEFGKPVKAFVDYLSLSTTFFIWLFARRLFEREPHRGIAVAVVVLFTLCWALGMLGARTFCSCQRRLRLLRHPPRFIGSRRRHHLHRMERSR